jgi:hypothetical protein
MRLEVRKTTRYAICSAHNNDFAGTIDDALASQLIATRNLLRLKSGSGDQALALKKVQAGRSKINIKGDGRLELADKLFTIEKLSEDSWSVHLSVNSEDEINRYIPNIAEKLRIPEDGLRSQLAGAQISLVSERPDFIGHQLSFGGPEAIRSMVKAGLVLGARLLETTKFAVHLTMQHAVSSVTQASSLFAPEQISIQGTMQT